jgi:hypothetical protein
MTQDQPTPGDPATCPSCHSVLLGEYCYRCGERRLSSADFSLVRFIKESLDVFTHYDSKLYTSVALLMSKPGFLTVEFFKGRRVLYVKPVQLFLLINIFYFLAVSLFGWNTFATRLDIHRTNTYYGSLAEALVETRLADRSISLEQYRTTFDHASTTFSKSLIFTMIPFLALLLQALYWRPGYYYVENLVFSLHFLASLLLYLVGAGVFLKLAMLILSVLSHRDVTGYTDLVGTIMVAAGILPYLYLALRRVRAQSALLTLAKAFLLTYLSFWVLWIYRFILFVICFIFT